MKRFKVIIFIFVLKVCVYSQDIHFSQYNSSLLNLSPSMTGLFDGDYRFNAIYRKQWQAVPVPYSTISMSAEGKWNIAKMKKNISYGVLFNHDKSGDALYTINQVYLSLGYLHKLNKDSTLLMNAGFQLGYASNVFNYNKMTFDAQFDGLSFNSSAPTNESFYRTSLHYWDVNVGAAFRYVLNQKTHFTYAFSWLHLNNPLVTYYANTSSRIDKKFSNYFALQYPLNTSILLFPELLWNFQGKYRELVPGIQLGYLINNLDEIYGRAGVYFRNKDALILRIGLDYQYTSIGMSYDINVSKFVAATNSRGGFEMYVIHILKTKRNYLIKKKPCPVFL